MTVVSTMQADGSFVLDDGAATDLSMDFWDLLNAARSIPRSAKDLLQPAVCWGKQTLSRTLANYWKRHAPTQVAPGTRRIVDFKPSTRKAGEVYQRTTHYDEFGRSVGQTHMTDHGEPDVHPVPHYHTRDPITGQEAGPFPGVHPDY